MTLIIDGHTYDYELANLCRIFFPYQQIHVVNTMECSESVTAYTGVLQENGATVLKVSLKIGDRFQQNQDTMPAGIPDFDRECELRLAILLYSLLVEMCGYTPKWGLLTGVRPIKLLRRLIAEMGEEEATDYYRNRLFVSQEKTELSLITMNNEQKILSLSRPESFSLYVSIPFCPTRCSYCSFVSQSVVKAARLIPDYVRLLCEELIYTAKVAAELGLRLESVYIGGGTPTTLSAEQLGTLIDTIQSSFNMATCREFTVEAGRPDTITREKLLAMKSRGVTRISINPQTLSDEVLQTIGRRHSAAQTLEAFALARECGLNNINMDLIAGLPRDTVQSFTATLDKILSLTPLSPESITVHTLALKRAARLNTQKETYDNLKANGVPEMMEETLDFAKKHDYLPYYLYRQKNMADNLENIGYARYGKEGLYNILIMEEKQTILALGAGGMSKFVFHGEDRIERVDNVKSVTDYISRIDEMIKRKHDFISNNYR
jgi:oxygen-independent coproporphyrinogen-3 oxidase